MYRLLVLSGLATVIVTFPAFAGAGTTTPPDDAIGAMISGQAGARAADYWTPARMAAARELTLLVRSRDGTARVQS